MIRRRDLLGVLTAGGVLAAMPGCMSLRAKPAAARVVVVGGGYGGATTAKYIRLFSDRAIDVILIEPQEAFVSSPISNLVVGGELQMVDLTSSYDTLRDRHGIKIVRDRATGIDPTRRTVRLAGGTSLRFDKVVLAPGIDPILDAVEGLAAASASGDILQAWSASLETTALRRQLVAMPDGGVFAITIPESPYRCPPAPYERATLVAAYFKIYKPRSKVLVLDANQDVTAMASLFKQAWADLYGDMLEYRNHYRAVAVDSKSLTVKFDVQEDVHADVLNVLPPVRAGALAVAAGLANVNARWCGVDFQTFASTLHPHVHIVGDSIQGAEHMPKSGHVANGQAKVAAAAIVAELLGLNINSEPMISNTCYSFVSPREAIHASAVFQYVPSQKTFKPVEGAGGFSPARSESEATYAMAWARNIWADMLG